MKRRWRCATREDAALLALPARSRSSAHETGVTNTLVDPVGGSYAIETLTDEIESRATEYIARIDALRRRELRGIESRNTSRREIQKAAYEYQRAVERREQIVVGVNQYVAEKETPIPTMRVDPGLERAQIERVRALRARRDSSRATAAVAEVERRARTGENLLPAIAAAVEAYATVGEISDALRRVFGEHTESVVL